MKGELLEFPLANKTAASVFVDLRTGANGSQDIAMQSGWTRAYDGSGMADLNISIVAGLLEERLVSSHWQS